jgi:hypothetical protein
MQIKTALRFGLTLVKMAIIKKTNRNKCWQGYGGKESPTLLVGMLTSSATVEISMAVPQNFKIELPSNPAIPLWVYTRKNQSQLIIVIVCITVIITALFIIAKS